LYGIFDTPSDAALSLDGKSDSKYIRRYINLERPVMVGPNRDTVFFVMHPDWKTDVKGRIGVRNPERKKSSLSKSIVLFDTKNKTALLFNTVSDLLVFFRKKACKWYWICKKLYESS
jgi:hypothetical protein